ncbi:MAG: NADPH-dependent F420 reductase [Myxococcota bacterium]
MGSFEEAAAFGEMAVLATKWEGTHHALELAKGKQKLKGKVVIDVTNPLDFTKGMPPTLAVGGNDSGGETVQRWLPEAKVVKAFNIIGNQYMYKPDFPGGPPDMFIGGNDETAKNMVSGLLKSFGWSVIDLGNIQVSRYLEPLAMAWITYGARTNSWSHAFKLLRK